MEQNGQPLREVGRLISLVPVALKEAAIDSPTSRATISHYAEQTDIMERWLDDYLKATNRVLTENMVLESILSNLSNFATLPTSISESMVDHDYSILAMRKYGEGPKAYFMNSTATFKRLTALVVEPIKHFQQTDLKAFKEARKLVEHYQKTYDGLHVKYAAMGKSKEASSLREDAFQLHEMRRMYLRASMDFFALAPQVRYSFDKLLVRIFYDQWKEMRTSAESTATSFQKGVAEMERVKGWMTEIEASSKSFRTELLTSKKQLEEAAELAARPSREIEDYSTSTVPQLPGHSHSLSGVTLQRSPTKAAASTGDKQGWIFLRTFVGKPTRTVWVRRWAFIRGGVFGWLIYNPRTGGVEETERIGVLLCSIRPAPTEERRYCFELKTNKNTILLQTDTQSELVAWISAIETAKAKAVESPNPNSSVPTTRGFVDAAFSITLPSVPEFGTSILSTTEPGTTDDPITTTDRLGNLPSSGHDLSRDAIVETPRRSATTDETVKDGHTRLLSKIDIQKKGVLAGPASPSPLSGGGIASLIAASHGSMPVGPSIPVGSTVHDTVKFKPAFTLALRDMPPNSLAPSTLAAVPTPTNLSRSAVIVTGERGLGKTSENPSLPNGLLVNTWGTSSTGFVNRLGPPDPAVSPGKSAVSFIPSPLLNPAGITTKPPASPGLSGHASVSHLDLSTPLGPGRSRTPSPSKRHRNTISMDRESARQLRSDIRQWTYPSFYPIQLRSQDAQFRLLFPTVCHDEHLVLVFRATWNLNDQQEFPGRVYTTSREMYFYSNHLGLVLTTSVSLTAIEEATAAPGRECDFIFLHLKDYSIDGMAKRIDIKTFLEPLRLLQRRINFLIKNSMTAEPLSLEELLKVLVKLESEARDRSPSNESWEDVDPETPMDYTNQGHRGRAVTLGAEWKVPVKVDRALHTSVSASGTQQAKFKLPAHPVKYTPHGNLKLAVDREFDISPKALFHVMFGDNSVLWQLLQHERRAKNLSQGPWTSMGESRLRREFEFDIPTVNAFGQETVSRVRDYQVIDVNSDHLCYVVTDKRTPWHLPYQNSYRMVSKIVITHVAKGRCKLAVFIKVEWLREAWLLKGILERQGLYDLDLDSQDLADLVTDQVRKLGAYSHTKKAVQIFGQVGQSNATTQLQVDSSALNIEMRRTPIPRTMTGLLAESAGSGLQSMTGTVLEGVIDVVKWIAKACSANKFILLILGLSVVWNSWHSYRDGVEWWQERNARNFMDRLGVTPNKVMGKAVYISDLDELLTQSGQLPNSSASTCYTVFHNEHRIDDINSPITHLSLSKELKVGVEKMQETRRRLGNFRHDLLVSMRMVNSIERQILQSEWEQWLTSENRRCRQVENLFKRNDNETDPEVWSWYDDYCRSCHDEFGKLRLT